ncbi:MAG: sulfatase [Thermoanaerobaculia bacterium]
MRANLLVVASLLWACASPSSRVDSVLVIVVDTLRADALGVMGYARPTTPEIDRWARRARVYENAYSTAPWTLPAFGSLLTGTWPAVHGAGRAEDGRGDQPPFSPLDPGVPTVAEILSAAGWSSAAFVNNDFLAPHFDLGRGFDMWDFRPASRHGYRRADRVVDGALAWLRSHRDERYFLLVHLFDPHLPYGAPEPYLGRWGGAAAQSEVRTTVHELRARLRSGEGVSIATLRAAYDEEVRFTDAQVGRLLRGLGELGLARRTAVLLTADHGEEFQDHGGFEHGHTMFDELLRVPMLLEVPGGPAGRIDEPVSLVDVAPTVLDLLGVAAAKPMAGVSLARRPPAGTRTLIAEDLLYGPAGRAAVRWPWKLVTVGSRARLHRLDYDRDESTNIAAERSKIVDVLRADITAVGARVARARGPVELDDRATRNLRSLGYVD